MTRRLDGANITRQEYPGAQDAGGPSQWGHNAFDMMNFASSVDLSGIPVAMTHQTPFPGQDMFDLMGEPDYVVDASLGSGGG